MPSSAPPPPDYKGAAEEQGKSSLEAIQAQTQANRPNMNTPWGSMTWTNNNGNWTGNVSLSPEEEAAMKSQEAVKGGLSSQAQGLLGQVGEASQKPWDWNGLTKVGDGQAVRDQAINATWDQQKRMLDPMWSQREEQEKSAILNSGGDPNSQAAKDEMQRFSTQRDASYQNAQDSAIQSGAAAAQQLWGMDMGKRQQGISEMVQQHTLPLNELDALLSGQQVGMPQMPQFAMAGAAQPTNYLGAQQALGQYGLDASQMNNAFWGDIAGGAMNGAASAIRFSDARLKENIIYSGIEVLPGVQIACWRWKGTKQWTHGVIAQDVAKVRPDLVSRHRSGYLQVNYAEIFGRAS